MLNLRTLICNSWILLGQNNVTEGAVGSWGQGEQVNGPREELSIRTSCTGCMVVLSAAIFPVLWNSKSIDFTVHMSQARNIHVHP